MNFSKIKITDSQNLLLQGFLSILAGAVLAFVTAVIQYISQRGTFSLSTALSVGVAAFLYAFGLALKAYVPAHAQQELQAVQDAKKQVEDALTNLQQSQPVVATPLQASPPINGPLVVVNHPASVPASVEVAYNQALQEKSVIFQQPVQGTAIQNSATQIAVLPQQQAHASVSLVDEFPDNPVHSEMPSHLAMLTDMQTQPQQAVQQQPFPTQPQNDDTQTRVQAARMK